MTLSSRTLKVMSAAGTVAVCGVSGLLVTSDPKPTAAPLRPPLSSVAPLSASTGGAVTPSVADASPGTTPLTSSYVS